MLEVRNLKKVYKSKKGTNTNALNGVSIKFADRGLVFILGKSGSGKSTLLNVLGGLDSFDAGEIIISGITSKSFKPSDYDSYRNTYLGFVFQEFNIIEDFSVEKNIALALQLQHKKSDKIAIENILAQVELAGYGARKPNELSGGQKQRVAIARALVKNPKVIFADEPTGALDSETGKSVLDTLKTLSQEKLVIVVTHDREFADEYGDRIIELKDGVVISDRTRASRSVDAFVDTDKIQLVDKNVLKIPKGKKLTLEHLEALNQILEECTNDTYFIPANFEAVESVYPESANNIISNGYTLKGQFNATEVEEIVEVDKKSEKIDLKKIMNFKEILASDSTTEEGKKLSFSESAENSFKKFKVALVNLKAAKKENSAIKDVEDAERKALKDKENLNKKMNLIRSKLPIMDSLKLAASNFKTKKARLVITLLLSMLALVFFGFADIMASYDKTESYTTTFYEGQAWYLGAKKVEKITPDPENNPTWSYNVDGKLSQNDMDFFEKTLKNSYSQVFHFRTGGYSGYDAMFYENSSDQIFNASQFDYSGYIEMAEDQFKLAYGKAPSNYNEILISDFFAENYLKLGLKATVGDETLKLVISNYDQLIDQRIEINEVSYKIVGIFQTNYYYYKQLLDGKSMQDIYDNADLNKIYNRYTEDSNLIYNKIVVSKGFSDNFKKGFTTFDAQIQSDLPSLQGGVFPLTIGVNSKLKLKENQVIMSASAYRQLTYGYESNASFDDLSKDFKNSKSTRFYVTNNTFSQNAKIVFEANYEVVGLFNDLNRWSNSMSAMKPSIGGGAIIGGFSTGNMLYMNQADFDKVVDALYVPAQVVINSVLSGGELYNMIDPLEKAGYKVFARNQNELDMVDSLMATFMQAFFIAAGVLAVFVTLLLYNFISTSIVNKKKEIGILRAIGARGIDVMLIFVFESLFLAAIILALSIPTIIALSGVVNNLFMTAFPVSIISFKVRQLFTMGGITLLIMLISSFFPVYKISRKKPIDAILNKG